VADYGVRRHGGALAPAPRETMRRVPQHDSAHVTGQIDYGHDAQARVEWSPTPSSRGRRAQGNSSWMIRLDTPPPLRHAHKRYR
jgi:hypothetical protein